MCQKTLKDCQEKTENAGGNEHWMRINHLMAALREKLDQVTQKGTSSGHVDLGRKRLLNVEQDVETIASSLLEWTPKISEKDQPIIILLTLQLVCRKISYILDILLVLESSA